MAMRANALAKAVQEAERFLAVAEELRILTGTREDVNGDPWFEGGQYCAAVKRSSMDLTRALAELRRRY